ncbi:DHH family phosphoesterase [bacterium]|nr:DHH family phosphoesterase [bacterium]
MGKKFQHWIPRTPRPPASQAELASLLLANRKFEPLDKLEYGDHGLTDVVQTVSEALDAGKRIALYADYDVDGTMSCVSWVWFLRAAGYTNFVTYIPCRFKEGYGVNLTAVQHLIENEKVDLIITMDTGITANEEARYCRERGVQFICTDHHQIQRDKMPDCITLNPKMHPHEDYQDLCGCGITFVLLRRLAEKHPVPQELWTDLLALAGMATICDVVPLRRVNHRLARLGVSALLRSERPVLARLREAASLQEKLDEKDVGFRLGPRINAVGRLGHADQVVQAFIGEDPEPLIRYMGECNEERKKIQARIVREALLLGADQPDVPVLVLGGDWHPGVVGIAASRIAETFWKPTWLFQRGEKLAKGSARSIPGFDVTAAMQSCGSLFTKFGGHTAAGGFAFDPEKENAIREALTAYALEQRNQKPQLWQSSALYDCELPTELATLELADAIEKWRPYGNSFEEPRFKITGKIFSTQYYNDKQTGERKHTAILVGENVRTARKILFFNEVIEDVAQKETATFLVSAKRDTFRGTASLSLLGIDYATGE